jgi:dTDP-4-dehydrorhamnose reductase
MTRTSDSLRVLVLGASGMLGHVLIRVLNTRHDVYGTTQSERQPTPPLATVLERGHWIGGVDGCNWPTLEVVIRDIRPDVVVNCIGVIKQKLSTPRTIEAITLNSLLPHKIAELCQAIDSRLIHISTDCVFSGNPGTKTLAEKPDAADLYGITKRLGEVEYGRTLTLRTGFIGRQLTGSEGLLEWVLSQRGRTITGYVNAIYSGLTTLALSRVIQALIEDHPSVSGLFQVASTPISKYDLISRVNCYLNLGMIVNRDVDFYCDRSLDGSHFTSVTNIRIPSWETMLIELAEDSNFYSFREF